jgi:hypothetical protein
MLIAAGERDRNDAQNVVEKMLNAGLFCELKEHVGLSPVLHMKGKERTTFE